MKVALLIFPLHYSHGCILQTYALYSKLKECGHNVTILNRRPPKQSLWNWLILILKRLIKYILLGYRGGILYKGTYPSVIMSKQQPFIDRFRENIVDYYSSEELYELVRDGGYDAIIVGSDQTWRPKNVRNVMDYWLGFASNINICKVAYAPSFGVEEWEYNEKQTEECRKLASFFKGISVREQSGVELCKKYLGIKVEHVLDPTMLWDKSFYEPFAKTYPIEKGMCQCYFLDYSNEKMDVATKISQLLHLELNNINTKTEDATAPIEERIAPSIEHWLAGFYYGEFIIVDSFHAMVFSIIFQKPFVVIGNVNRGLSRFESLLSELGLEKRLLTDANDLNSIISENIDWDIVNIRLSVCRKKSMHYLEQALI